MRAEFREHLREYVERNLKAPFGPLDKRQKSIWMARFYADAIVRPSNPTLIPQVEEDLAACLIDGADDDGVDFLARSENKVLIIQAKYSGGKKTGKKRSEV